MLSKVVELQVSLRHQNLSMLPFLFFSFFSFICFSIYCLVFFFFVARSCAWSRRPTVFYFLLVRTFASAFFSILMMAVFCFCFFFAIVQKCGARQTSGRRHGAGGKDEAPVRAGDLLAFFRELLAVPPLG